MTHAGDPPGPRTWGVEIAVSHFNPRNTAHAAQVVRGMLIRTWTPRQIRGRNIIFGGQREHVSLKIPSMPVC
ncbi:hypothetical protein CGRA01v4_13671 [Colletotrichum graminicola]|nr:hypothetical protein CGRA01v4_13671 [Colletotrichum graminicola]